MIKLKQLLHENTSFVEMTYVNPHDGDEMMVHYDVNDKKLSNPLRIYVYKDSSFVNYSDEDSDVKLSDKIKVVPTKNSLFYDVQPIPPYDFKKFMSFAKRWGYRL